MSEDAAGRRLVGSGTRWEPVVGCSRAVRVGPWVAPALEQVGARLDDVVRTRLFVTDTSRWEEVGRAHGEVFADRRPATTPVEVSALIDPALLVEVEADAVVTGPDARTGPGPVTMARPVTD